MRLWPREDNRTYHGIDGGDGISRIYVERAEYGPTEREEARLKGRLQLQELHPFDEAIGGGFGWGYNGGGTSRAAAAILADALNEDQDRYDFHTETDDTDQQLREDFCEDVLLHLCDEWRLSRGAVLRWARGWYAQRGITQLPRTLASMPPVARYFFER